MAKNFKAVRESYDSRKAMQLQLSMLFGADSELARSTAETPAQWRRTLKAVLGELKRYVTANIDTDVFHSMVVFSSLMEAEKALNHDDFWPGYVVGITQLALVLLGDSPDHRTQRSGRKKNEHYKLSRYRTVQWVQTPDQRLRTLFRVGLVGRPKLSADPNAVLRQFRAQYGSKPTYEDFLEWYRENLPQDYSTVFR